MAEDEPKTLRDVVNEISSKMRSKAGADFDERIEAFKEFHDPKNEYDNHFIEHASSIFMGDGKSQGIYHETYKHLDDKIPEINGKVSKDLAEEMIEKYVDAFLMKEHKNYEKALKQAEEEGLSKDEIKDLKQNLFNLYVTDENGRPVDLKERAKELTEKSKLEAKQNLRSYALKDSQIYASISMNKATQYLINEHDIIDLHNHLKPKFETAGLKSDDHNLTKSARDLALDYQTHIQGGDMNKRGYRKIDDYKEKS